MEACNTTKKRNFTKLENDLNKDREEEKSKIVLFGTGTGELGFRKAKNSTSGRKSLLHLAVLAWTTALQVMFKY